MISPRRILRDHREPIPDWLVRHKPNGRFPYKSFLKSRVVFYPASGTDGHPLEVFAKSHAAHCFVYADYEGPGNLGDIKGYHAITLKKIRPEKWFGEEWVSAFDPSEDWGWGERFAFKNARMKHHNKSFLAVWAVLEREDGLDDSHGPKRISILHFAYEYLSVFERFFCQEAKTAPYAVVLASTMNNWTNIGREDCRVLWMIRHYDLRMPDWLFVATEVGPWPGYNKVGDAHHCRSGASPKELFSLDTVKVHQC